MSNRKGWPYGEVTIFWPIGYLIYHFSATAASMRAEGYSQGWYAGVEAGREAAIRGADEIMKRFRPHSCYAEFAECVKEYARLCSIKDLNKE